MLRKPLSCERVRVNKDHELNRGLVNWWLLHEGGGNVAHDVVRNQDGPIISNLTWGATDKGSALSNITASGYIDITNSTWGSSNGFVLSVWFRLSTLSQNGILINSGSTAIAFGLYSTGDKILCGNSSVQVGLTPISAYLTTLRWHHVLYAPWSASVVPIVFLDGKRMTLANVSDYYVAATGLTVAGRSSGTASLQGKVLSIEAHRWYGSSTVGPTDAFVAALYRNPYGTPRNPRLIRW